MEILLWVTTLIPPEIGFTPANSPQTFLLKYFDGSNFPHACHGNYGHSRVVTVLAKMAVAEVGYGAPNGPSRVGVEASVTSSADTTYAEYLNRINPGASAATLFKFEGSPVLEIYVGQGGAGHGDGKSFVGRRFVPDFEGTIHKGQNSSKDSPGVVRRNGPLESRWYRDSHGGQRCGDQGQSK
jgi:hypothetical protein